MAQTNSTLEILKALRDETGLGVMECRKALDEAGQNYTNALDRLREIAAAKAKKRAENEAVEGVIELYSHASGRIGVMVEVNTETEFAASSEVFRKFVHEIALQVASENPLYVRDTDIPSSVLEEVGLEAAARARASGKPEPIIARIVDGAVEKYRNTHVLLRQNYIRDESLTIARLLDQVMGQIRENVVIRRFQRWVISSDTEE